MGKRTSAGIIIQNELDEFLFGRVTYQDFYDIFKGRADPGESMVEAAIRECVEESGLVFFKEQLTDLGGYIYNNNKNLHLYLSVVEKHTIYMPKLHCYSMVNKDAEVFPEMDHYQWFSIEEVLMNTTKSMNRIWKHMLSCGTIKVSKLPKNYQKIEGKGK